MAFGIPSSLATAANVISAAAGLSTMTAHGQAAPARIDNPSPWYRPDNLASTLWRHKFLVGGVALAAYFIFKGKR